MNKKIILSLSVIGIVAAIAIGGTIAYFSDTETSTGNTFTAGTLDLKIDSECTYNGQTSDQCGTWTLQDGDLTSQKFFNFSDVKPGDEGENTVSLHVYDNDAWVCATIENLTNAENGCNEPEIGAEPACDQDANGELQNALEFTIWRDGNCDNQYNENDVYLVENADAANGTWALYDSTTGAPLEGGTTACIGIAWNVPAGTGNEIQSDSLTGDISFYAEQARNNPNFKCVQPETTTVQSSVFNFSGTGWAGWSCPSGYPNIVSADTTNCTLALNYSLAWEAGASVPGFSYPATPFGYTYGTGEEGWILQNGGTSQSCYIVLTCQAN